VGSEAPEKAKIASASITHCTTRPGMEFDPNIVGDFSILARIPSAANAPI